MPSTGYNVDRAFFRLAMQETLIIIREYNAFIFRRMPELLVRSLVRERVRARSLSIMEPRRALSSASSFDKAWRWTDRWFPA